MGKQNDNVKNQHGGKRPGSGAKKKSSTKVISVRVLVEDYEVLKAKINEVVKDHYIIPKDFLPIEFKSNVVDGVLQSITITHKGGTGYTSMPKE
jgi:hypothetical protein